MKPLTLAVLLLAGFQPASLGAETAAPVARNLFAELLGKSEAELDAKIDTAWRQLFHGNDETQRVYFPVGTDMAYIADIGSGDVRSEGMSYGMMLAVQLDKKEEFDRLWKWAVTHMRHADGPRQGYFAWQCKFDGTIMDPGSASDGEEWFAMALLFASHRWQKGRASPPDKPLFDYEAQAQALLRKMLHKPGTAEVTAIFNREQRQVVFVPNPAAGRFTDPSYHLPAFYELWGRWADNPSDRRFWASAADISRAFFRNAANPQTGLMPEYAYFDGRPHTAFAQDKGDFRYDAWRTLANAGLDYAWWKADPWQVEQSNRVLRFLASQGPKIPNQFTLGGKPLSTDTSTGLIAMAAVAGQAADPDVARPFVQQLWDAPLPTGKWRYYNGLLYFLGLLEAGGRFQVYGPVADSK